VVKFGKILGREIVAEGIETEEEMAAMQAAGATHLQGYLFSRALPADHIEAIAATFGTATFGRAALAPEVQANGQGKRARPTRPLASLLAKPASKTG
jgi:predicted signal transduction protein with EAL and GGDEF domain